MLISDARLFCHTSTAALFIMVAIGLCCPMLCSVVMVMLVILIARLFVGHIHRGGRWLFYLYDHTSTAAHVIIVS